MEANVCAIEEILASIRPATLLDLGCDIGVNTVRFAAAAESASVHGVEIASAPAQEAAARGIKVTVTDLNDRLPFEDESFDAVVSNQVFEHVPDTDHFIEETYRIVKPGGCVITSTENLASWHNIASLVVGWQPFSLTNVSRTTFGIGNPLAVHRMAQTPSVFRGHLRVFAYRGLREVFAAHGFLVEAVIGAGYFPLPPRVATWDPKHAAFLTVKAFRPPNT